MVYQIHKYKFQLHAQTAEMKNCIFTMIIYRTILKMLQQMNKEVNSNYHKEIGYNVWANILTV